MGQPGWLKTSHRKEQTRRTETSKYPEEEKIINDSDSSGERNRNSPNQNCFGNSGVVGPRCEMFHKVESTGKLNHRG
nr:hypothetical protein [uncultured bacterium]